MTATATLTNACPKTSQEDIFVSASEAMRRSGLGRHWIKTAAAAGRIRVSAIPGVPLKYHVGDAIRLAHEGH